jgi:hypothetical protein
MSLVLPSLIGANKPAGGGAFSNDFSVSFDGSDDFASVNGDSNIQLHDNFTISAWFRTGSTVTSNGGIIGWGQQAVGKFRGFGLNSNNELVFNAYGRFYNPTGATALSANTWYHGLLTVTATSGQNNTATVYINGSQDSQITSGVLAYSYSSTNVAQSYYGGSERFLGHIDELSLFNSVLSATDIATIYNGGNGPADIKDLNPVAWWRMGDGTENASGTTVYDMSDNSNNLTLYNGPTFSTTVPA